MGHGSGWGIFHIQKNYIVMIIYTGEITTESPQVTLNESFINLVSIPLQNVSEGVFNAKAQIGIFDVQENI